jgi:hypothetical protein
MIIDSPIISGSIPASFKSITVSGSMNVTGTLVAAGDTKHGVLSSNTHVFTGSMSVTERTNIYNTGR